MKNILASILVLLLHSGAFATTYYVTASGSDGDGKTTATAWKTLAKLNAVWKSGIFKGGDSILLHRGESFYGSITPATSGSSTAPIVISSYGTGAQPIVTSFIDITSWPTVSGNKYTSAALPSTYTDPEFVRIDGKIQPLGRWPNASAANRGYFKYNTPTFAKGNFTYIQDTAWGRKAKPNNSTFSGGQIAFRQSDFKFSVYPLSLSVTGTAPVQTAKFTLSSSTDIMDIRDGNGYFIQNHIDCLDSTGEWCYNKTARTISVYYPTSLTAHKVEISTKDTLVNLALASYITIDGIYFYGTNERGVYAGGSNRTDIYFKNCNINITKRNAVKADNVNNLFFFNNTVDSSFTNAFYITQDGLGADTSAFLRNTIKNTFVVYGMNYPQDPLMGYAVSHYGSRMLWQYNKFLNSGYTAIDFEKGNNQFIFNNISDGTQTKLGDGGAFYTNNQFYEFQWNKNRIVKGNFLYNTDNGDNVSGLMGQTAFTMGLYADLFSTGIQYIGNFVKQGRVQLYLNDPTNMVIKDNIFYNWGTTSGGGGSSAVEFRNVKVAGSTYSWDNVVKTTSTPAISGNVMSNNIFFNSSASTSPPKSVWATKISKSDTTKYPLNYGSFDNNYFVYNRTPLTSTIQKDQEFYATLPYTTNTRTLSQWTALLGYETNSKLTPVVPFTSTTMPATPDTLIVNDTEFSRTTTLGGKTWVTARGVPVTGNTLTLAPYTAEVLIYTGKFSGNTAPAVAITAPVANQAYTVTNPVDIAATASDAGGTITKVEFYAGGTLLYTDTVSPYSYKWVTSVAGNYNLTAKATDNGGLSTTSVAVPISVNPIAAPSVSMTSPANNASYTAPATIDMSASASSGSKIVKVEFFSTVGTTSTLLFTDFAAPYAYTWTNVPVGNYTLTAKATDSLAKTATSGGVAVTVASGNNAPSVSLTSPLDSATYTSPASVSLSAIATDDGSVSSVKFYNGSTLIATGTLSTVYANTYTATWSSVPTGKYNITAIATDNLGATKTSAVASINVGASLAPKASMTSPINGASFYVTDSVLLAATATDDGRVDSVVFYSNGIRLWRETTAPYEKKFKFAAGSYTFTAIAYDNSLLSTTSGSVSITVKAVPANQPPQVNVSSPLSGAVYTAPATIDITAAASDPDGSVASVTFYNGSTQLAVDNTAPYTFQWSGVAAGNYNITAKAVDNLGLATTSSSIAVAVNAPPQFPTVSITAPSNNTNYTAPASIDINATASDPDGTIQRVEFYRDSTLLGSDNTSPYSYTLTGLPVGTYKLTAKAFDNSGLSSTSGIVNVVVNAIPNLKPSVSITAPVDGAAFTQPANVKVAAAASDADGTVTRVNFYDNNTILYSATNPLDFSYTYNSIPTGAHIFTAVAVDDKGDSTVSAAVSVNVVAANIAPSATITAPSGGANYIALADINISVTPTDADGKVIATNLFNGSTLIYTDSTGAPFTYKWSGVGAGSYSLTAVATDNQGAIGTSAAVSLSVRNLVSPSVSITSPVNNATYLAPATVAIAATAADPDGTVKKVEFYRGATLISTDTTAPYTASAASLAAGTYQLTAKAFDNDNQSTISASVNIVVNAPKTPPSVAMTSPANNSSFGDTVAVKLTANASDLDGTIKKVDFYNGTTLIASSTTSPYSAIWTNMSAGAHSITAKATDNDNLVTASAPITVNIVHKNILPSVAIIAPQNNAIAYKKTATTLAATATDADGNIVRVEFYVKGTLVGQSTAAPYSTTWSAAVTGAYTITAKAYDNNGGVTTSSPITVNVTDKPIKISGAQIIIVQ